MNDEDRYENPESMVTCPYNPAHSLLKFKMSRHLVKCRKQHLEISKELRTCPFNNTHQIPPIELPYHESICPDRENFYNFAYRMEDRPNRAVDELVNNSRIPIEIDNTENWDEEINPAQDIISTIREDAEKRIVLQNNSNLPPAERRAKIYEQRSRMREILNTEDNNFRSSLPSTSGRSVGSSSVASFGSATSGAFSGSQGYGSEMNRSTRGRGKNTPSKKSKDIGFGRGRKP